MKGTYLLLKAAVENGVCETLGIDPFDNDGSVVQKELKEAKQMEEILESRKVNKPVVSC